MRIRNLLGRAVAELRKANIPTPDLDARVLLSAALDQDSVFILTHPENLLTNREYSKFRKYIRRRKLLEPIAYILGHKEFYGYDFHINKNVLVPRPETEFLVESSLEIINHNYKNKQLSILDMGTGSGCIILSIAKELDKNLDLQAFKFYGADNSKKALYVAKKNALALGLNKKIKFFKSNLFSNNKMPKYYDLIVANLPYVPIESKNNVKNPIDFEPQAAIFAKNNGTEVLTNFLDYFKHKIKADYILMELDPRNIEMVEKYSKTMFPSANIKIKKDLAGKARYLFIEQ